jgi:hypothetical protein
MAELRVFYQAVKHVRTVEVRENFGDANLKNCAQGREGENSIS